MATKPYELTRLDPHTFEHLANMLAMKVLGCGHTGFGPGPDGGRDGFFEGEAPYPSDTERWSGTWIIQSKFHSPHLSTDAQKWLQRQVIAELDLFDDEETNREWPDNWIITTNIEISGVPVTGTFDVIRKAIREKRPELADKFSIWDGQKILSLLAQYTDIRDYYGGFLTSGDAIAAMVASINDGHASIKDILHYLVVTQFSDQQFTKLEQAGSSSDSRTGIHRLFVDLPFYYRDEEYDEKALSALTATLADTHKIKPEFDGGPPLEQWYNAPKRARIWFVKGGPGQGKSTLTQYVCQIQRAKIITTQPQFTVHPNIIDLANEVRTQAEGAGYWPSRPRLPVLLELRSYAQWYGDQKVGAPNGVLTYLAHHLSSRIEQQVVIGTIRRAFAEGSWLFVFDGLDEVPGDVKDDVADQITLFCNDVLIKADCDAAIVCTSRPQGYSGQFDSLAASLIELSPLSPSEALACAKTVLDHERPAEEAEANLAILQEAINSPAVREIMTTPLQSHIMAVVVRDGGRPPERKWALFSNFYQVIKKRESNRNLPDKRIAQMLRDSDKLIKELHNRLGFELHYRAERSSGASTSLSKGELNLLIREVVTSLLDDKIEETIDLLMEATTERLVLVNTPENGDYVRFDIRPLQEFFAAEYLYESASDDGFVERIRTISVDSHWREVMHFIVSALVEQDRRVQLALVVQVLAEVDNPATEDVRTLARRLAVGGIVSSRVLREGVLESDKRTRLAFRSCFGALLGSTDASSILPDTEPPHSRAWLIALLRSTATEHAPAENIGALCIAAGLKDLETNIAREFYDYINDQTSDYISCVIEHLPAVQTSDAAPGHLLNFLLDSIFSDRWWQISNNGLAVAFQILTNNRKTFEEEICSRGYSIEAAKLSYALLNDSVTRDRNTRERVKSLYGVLEVGSQSCTPEISADAWSIAPREELIRMGGVISACVKIIDRAYGCETEAAHCIPIELQKKLPTQVENFFCDHTSNHRQEAGSAAVYMYAESPSGPADWAGVIREFPGIFNSHFHNTRTDRHHNDVERFLRLDGSAEIVVTALVNSPKMFRGSVRVWPAIFSKLPHFKDRFVREAGKVKPQVERFAPMGHLKGFPLILPEDGALLPHIVATITSEQRSHTYYGFPRRDISQAAAEYVENVASLLALVGDETLSPPTRAASATLAMAMLDPECADYRNVIAALSEIDARLAGEWFIESALTFLGPGIRGQVKVAERFADKILRDCRDQFSVRTSVEPVIREWREFTRSPVSEAITRTIWH